MAHQEDPSSEEKEEKEVNSSQFGRKKYSRLVRMFKEGYLSVAIYKNAYERRTFYDVVIYRKIKTPKGYAYRRGTNLKPSDVSDLLILLREANEYLSTADH